MKTLYPPYSICQYLNIFFSACPIFSFDSAFNDIFTLEKTGHKERTGLIKYGQRFSLLQDFPLVHHKYLGTRLQSLVKIMALPLDGLPAAKSAGNPLLLI
ncbi:hypothetical protein JT05_08445 [Desulfosporosinus sp. Tol-M]|nr:hypothetical protein JT05_08445 [Desulfosporosinus sp. Tol-M]